MIYATALHIIDNQVIVIQPFSVKEEKDGYRIMLEQFDSYFLLKDMKEMKHDQIVFYYYSPTEKRIIETYEMLTGPDFSRMISLAVSKNEDFIRIYYCGLMDMASCTNKIFGGNNV